MDQYDWWVSIGDILKATPLSRKFVEDKNVLSQLSSGNFIRLDLVFLLLLDVRFI